MKTLPRLFTAALALGFASIVLAQTSDSNGPRGPRRGGPGDHGGPGRGHPIVRVLDADKNHELSATELANASAAIRTLDANNDDAVAAEELRPARPADAPTPPAGRPEGRARRANADHPRPGNPIMLALDADADGALSTAEINNATASLLALDSNKDGKLTRDEFSPLPPKRSDE